MSNQCLDSRWRTGPEHQAVSGVGEAGVLPGVHELVEDRVESDAVEVRASEFLPLGSVPGISMFGVASLDFLRFGFR